MDIIKFYKCKYEQLSTYRRMCGKYQTFAPNCSVEFMIENADCYAIFNESHSIGYFCIADGILLDFALNKECEQLLNTCVSEIIKQYKLKKIYCMTTDKALMAFCMQSDFKFDLALHVFGKLNISKSYEMPADIIVRRATGKDYELLIAQQDGLYESPDEITHYLTDKYECRLYLFFREKTLLGAGYLSLLPLNRQYVDLGMWVNPDERNQGIATWIVSFMKKLCKNNFEIPVASCAKNNLASKHILEKNGFYNNCELLLFKVK